MNCSDATGALIDQEVKRILKEAYDKAKKIIEDHQEVMHKIAEFLITKETITGKEFMEIFNSYEAEKNGQAGSEQTEDEQAKAEEADIVETEDAGEVIISDHQAESDGDAAIPEGEKANQES